MRSLPSQSAGARLKSARQSSGLSEIIPSRIRVAPRTVEAEMYTPFGRDSIRSHAVEGVRSTWGPFPGPHLQWFGECSAPRRAKGAMCLESAMLHRTEGGMGQSVAPTLKSVISFFDCGFGMTRSDALTVSVKGKQVRRGSCAQFTGAIQARIFRLPARPLL